MKQQRTEVTHKRIYMAKLKTLAEKQQIRYAMVYTAFGALIGILISTFGLLAFGIDPSPAAGIVGAVAGTLGGVIIGFFATSPKDDHKEGFKDIKAIDLSSVTSTPKKTVRSGTKR